MVEILIKTRTAILHGGKRKHSKIIVEIANVEIYRQQSSEYGLTQEAVVKMIEDFVSGLRSGLSASGVDSSIKRVSF